MDKLVNKTKNIFFSRQQGIFASVLILSSMIVVSKIFGFLRYRTLVSFFNTEELDIYFAAFRIPDLIFEVLITGALTASFIPIFIKYQKNKEELSKNISSIINILFIIFFSISLIILILIGPITKLITPGYSVAKINQIIFFSRLILIGQLPFLILGNFLTGIGQANKTFFPSAIAPIFYNLAIIITTIFFAKTLYLLAPVVGVIIGAVFFLLIQLPILSSDKFKLRLVVKKTEGLIEFFHMVVPRTFTIIATQIDATIDLTLTTLAGSGAYTMFYLAQRLQLFPVSIIGIAFGQASLPYLSEMYQEGKSEELKRLIISSILNLLFLTAPIASFFIFARTPIVRLFFGGQRFDWNATVQTAITLSYFSFSLPFHSIYYFIVRVFYAILNTKIPFITSVISIVINAVLSIYFITFLKLPVWSLAISFSVSIILNVILLFLILIIKLKGLNLKELIVESIKIIIATIIPSIFSYHLIKLLDGLIFDTTRTINVFLLLLTGGTVFVLLYLFIAWLISIKEIYIIGRFFVKAKEYKKKLLEIYNPIEQ